MNALLASVPLVAVAEIGDKTQLLALMLSLHYAAPLAIILGIATATTLNHLASAWLGQTLGMHLASPLFSIAVALLFIGIGLWVLKPDKAEGINGKLLRLGPFAATFIAFFLAEIGDKTQLATVALGSEYASLLMVTLGTTIGMLIANVPVVVLGEKCVNRIPLDKVRMIAALAFIGFGAFQLVEVIGA